MVIDQRLREYLEYIGLAKNFSPLTLRTYSHVLGRFCSRFTTREVAAIPFYEVEDWMLYQAEEPSAKGKPKSPSTINTERAIVRGFLRYCRTSGDDMKFDPAMLANMKVRIKRKKALTPEQIIYAVRSIPYDKLRLCTLVMFYAGLRVGEVIKLRPRHVYGNQLLIEDSKSQEPRPAFIPPELAKELHSYIDANRITEGRIFDYGTQIKSLHYERYSTGGVRKQMQKFFAKAGIEATPHDLRHAFATMLHKNGADIFTIKEFLGHSDVRTTQGYIHMDDQDMASKHAALVTIKY